jgi:hypothetical protein
MYLFSFQRVSVFALFWFGLASAYAHIGYGGRDFGTFNGSVPQSVTLGGIPGAYQTVSGSFGWADGTDADYGDFHKLRPFRFTIEMPLTVTITVQASANGGAPVLGTLLPGFSIYQGLAHLPPAAADHDTAPVTLDYLATIPGPQEGAFNALGTWKAGNDDGVSPADLSTFTFMGYAVDGTAANFGPTPGVVGDGTADGLISASFFLSPGEYTLAIGGANYAGQSPMDTATYGFTANIATAPEPGSLALLAAATLTLATRRRRTASPFEFRRVAQSPPRISTLM